MSKKKFKNVRGFRDLVFGDASSLTYIERMIADIAASYGYSEVRLPYLEKTELFKRCVGEVTDIVQKEMYTFSDREKESLTLRPEGTASCIRAGIQNGWFYNKISRLYYSGPMFRHERPQQGRYRQFYQFGLELIGVSEPEADVELIALGNRVFKKLGLANKITLHINSLGDEKSMSCYKQKLVSYMLEHKDFLNVEELERLERNPLRILDSKNPKLTPILEQAPRIVDNLSAESKNKFNKVLSLLDDLQISYTVDHKLVRGLDYYSDVVYEWVTTELGSQGTLCAGGRYDKLLEHLGESNFATGLAFGLDRISLLLEYQDLKSVDAYIITQSEKANYLGLKLAEDLRIFNNNLSILQNYDNTSMKSQFKKADKSGASWALVLGEEEINQSKVSLKSLRTNGQEQISLPLKNIAEIAALISK